MSPDRGGRLLEPAGAETCNSNGVTDECLIVHVSGSSIFGRAMRSERKPGHRACSNTKRPSNHDPESGRVERRAHETDTCTQVGEDVADVRDDVRVVLYEILNLSREVQSPFADKRDDGGYKILQVDTLDEVA